MLHNLEVFVFRESLRSPDRVVVCGNHVFGVPSSRSRRTEYLCLGSHSLSLVGFTAPCLPVPLPLPLSPFLPLPFLPCPERRCPSTGRVHWCCSRQNDVARTSSQTGTHVLSRLACITSVFRTSVSLIPLCTKATFQRLHKWCSCAGFVHVNNEIKSVK